MKKAILTAAILLMASTAFATNGTFVSGSVYSLGSKTPNAFKPSPKVTIRYYMDGTAGGKSTDWAAVAYHQNAIGNKKGFAYWTSRTDPGLWYYKDETNGVDTTTVETAVGSGTTAPSEAGAGTAGWRPEGK